MDIERTMQFIVENLASVTTRLDKMAERQSRMEERQSQLDEEFTKRILASEERHDREMASIRAELRRGIRYSVEEHRRERVRRHELAARQEQHEKELEEFRKSFQNWLDWTRRGGNGHQAS
jgi:leucyl aminopeptidase (aminopeptidase T)